MDKLQEKSDRMFYNHGDILIKIFSVLVALLLLKLWFEATRLSVPVNENPVNSVQQN